MCTHILLRFLLWFTGEQYERSCNFVAEFVPLCMLLVEHVGSWASQFSLCLIYLFKMRFVYYIFVLVHICCDFLLYKYYVHSLSYVYACLNFFGFGYVYDCLNFSGLSVASVKQHDLGLQGRSPSKIIPSSSIDHQLCFSYNDQNCTWVFTFIVLSSSTNDLEL